MAKSFKLLLSEYIVNEYARQENDLREAERNIRWGNYCAFDVAHLQLLSTRFDCFKQFANDIMCLCKVSEDDVVSYVHDEIEKKRGDD